MRPETIGEFFIATLFLVVVAACGVMAKLQGTSHVTTLALIGSGGVLVSVYFGFRHLRRSKPYVREVRRGDWVIAHLNSPRGVSVKIPSTEHKHGKHPKVEFQKGESVYGSKDLEAVVSDDGEIEVFHPDNSFTPPHFKETRVIVRA